MAKDVNIHIKATGGPEAKQQLEGVADAAQKTGSGVQDMGSKALIGSGWVQKALSFLAGPLGFAGIAGAVAGGAIKVAQFFDEIKTRSDEAVRQVQSIRAAYADLFEVMDAFSEKSRQALTLETTALLQRTAVTEQIGLPVVTAYAREFKPLLKTGEITKPQYEQGLEQMLRYAGRGKAAVAPEMISLMGGWGIITPEKQGGFRRMVTEAAEAARMPEEDLIRSLGVGMPAIKAMGWTPEDALTAIATLAKGEIGRKRTTMPGATLQTLMGVEVPKELQKQIPKGLGKKPRELLAHLQTLQAKMPREQYVELLTSLVGAEAAPGFLKLTTAPPRGLREAITEAAGPVGIAREAQQEKERQATMEATVSKVEASGRYRRLETIREEKEMATHLRELGAEEQRIYREEPSTAPLQKWREFVTVGEEAEKERAAYDRWVDTLTNEEKAAYAREYAKTEKPADLGKLQRFSKETYGTGPYGVLAWKWKQMTSKEKVGALLEHTENPPTINYNDSHDTVVIHNPVVASDPNSIKGARSPKGLY